MGFRLAGTNRRRFALSIFAGLLILTLLVGCGSQSAAKFPSGPVKIVIGFKVGGIADVRVRALQPVLQDILGVPVVVENNDGAGGAIAAENVMKAKKDGHTLLYVFMPSAIAQKYIAGQNFDYLKDFTPVYGFSGEDYSFISVRPDSPIKTLDDFVASARERKITCGLAFGANSHLALAYFGHLIKAKQLVVVPYNSSSESITALVGGHVECAVTATGGAVNTMVNDGKVRALGISSEKRISQLPDVKTFTEQGINLTLEGVHGVVAPAGLPKEVLQELEAAFDKATRDPRFIEAMKKINAVPSSIGAAEFSKHIGAWQQSVEEAAEILKASVPK